MLKVQDTLPIAPPRISQVAALGALKAGKDWVRDQYATLNESRQFILDALHPMEIMGGSGAMYVMARLPQQNKEEEKDYNSFIPDDLEICRQLVEHYGIAIIPGSYCGFPGWIRVCYGMWLYSYTLLLVLGISLTTVCFVCVCVCVYVCTNYHFSSLVLLNISCV